MALVGLGAVAGLLFWSRLKVVTDTPKTAYAVPGDERAAENEPLKPESWREPE